MRCHQRACTGLKADSLRSASYPSWMLHRIPTCKNVTYNNWPPETHLNRRPRLQSPSHCDKVPPSGIPATAFSSPVCLESKPALPDRPNLFDQAGRLMVKSLTLPELQQWFEIQGERPSRADQLWRWLYGTGPRHPRPASGAPTPISSPHESAKPSATQLPTEPEAGVSGEVVGSLGGGWLPCGSDGGEGVVGGFSAGFLERIGPRLSLDGGLALESQVAAADGTRKLVFRVTQGAATGGRIESVLIPWFRDFDRRSDKRERPRYTLCVSSQVGCAMNCQFCYTGRMGLRGNLSTAQIIEQVLVARQLLGEEAAVGLGGGGGVGSASSSHTSAHTSSQPTSPPLTHLVFMGMGEPLDNAPAVFAALDVLTHPRGLGMSARRITVSTVGVLPQLTHFLNKYAPIQPPPSAIPSPRVALAVSIHAGTDSLRGALVPSNTRLALHTTKQSRPPPPAPPPAPPAGQHHHEDQSRQLSEQYEEGHSHNHQQIASSSSSPIELPESSLPSPSHTLNSPPSPTTTATSSFVPQDAISVSPSAPGAADAGGDPGSGRGPDDGRGSATSDAGYDGGGGGGADGAGGPQHLRGIAALSAVLAAHYPRTDRRPLRAGRYVLFEYTMLGGVNDSPADASALLHATRDIECSFNLIMFNPFPGTIYTPSTPGRVAAFMAVLRTGGRIVHVRHSKGDSGMAACGQLGEVGSGGRGGGARMLSGAMALAAAAAGAGTGAAGAVLTAGGEWPR